MHIVQWRIEQTTVNTNVADTIGHEYQKIISTEGQSLGITAGEYNIMVNTDKYRRIP